MLKIKSRIGVIMLTVVMVFMFLMGSVTAYANDSVKISNRANDKRYSLPYDIETGRMFADTSVSEMSGMDGIMRNTNVLGKGTLYCSEPLIGNPSGYAYTEAYSTSHRVRAKVDVTSNGSTQTSNWNTMLDTKASNSGTVKANASKAEFKGFHEIQSTSSSSTYSTTTNLSYV
jgi:hypothetical protein